MDRQRFEDDVEACARSASLAQRIGTIAGIVTLGLWTNRHNLTLAEQRLEAARNDLAQLSALKSDIIRLRAMLDESVEEHGVRIAVCAFPDVLLDGRRTYGPFWDSIRVRVLQRDEYRCQHANGSCAGPLQIHHCRPLSRGGTNELSNLVTLCRQHHGLQHPDNPAFHR